MHKGHFFFPIGLPLYSIIGSPPDEWVQRFQKIRETKRWRIEKQMMSQHIIHASRCQGIRMLRHAQKKGKWRDEKNYYVLRLPRISINFICILERAYDDLRGIKIASVILPTCPFCFTPCHSTNRLLNQSSLTVNSCWLFYYIPSPLLCPRFLSSAEWKYLMWCDWFPGCGGGASDFSWLLCRNSKQW